LKHRKLLYAVGSLVIVSSLIWLGAKDNVEKTQASESAGKSAVVNADAAKLAPTPAASQAPAASDPNVKAKDPNAAADSNDSGEIVNLKNVGMDKIIATLEEWTGKAIICSDDKLMASKLTVYYSKKMPRKNALELLYTAMQLRGIIVEETERVLYLKPLDKARLGVVPTIPEDVPLSRIDNKSQIVEKYFQLKNYSPSKMQQVISPMIADYGHITADETTNKIAVIETVENLIRIENVIAQFDQPDSNLVVRKIFELKEGDPAEIVQMLELLFKGGRQSRPGPGQPTQGKGSSVVIEVGETPIVLVADQKRKWIIVKSNATDMAQISEWIEKFDSTETASARRTTVINLNYVDAREVAKAVEDSLRNMAGMNLQSNIEIRPLPATKQLLISGNENNREMVQRLVAEIDVPSTGLLETRHFQIKHADPEEIKSYLEELYDITKKSSMPYWERSRQRQISADTVLVISFPILKQITVTASATNLEAIAKQIEGWDVPPDLKKDQYQILSLNNSDPVKMVDLLNKLFTDESGSGSRDWLDYIFGSQDEKKKIVGSLHGALAFEAVPETKKIIIISKIPEAYPVIEKLVKDLDREENAELPAVITLKYADAEDLCEQLNAILNETGTQSPVRRSKQGLEYKISEETGEQATASGSTQSQQNTTKVDNMMTPWWNRSRPDEKRMPTSNLIGKIRFVPVFRSKAILVLSPPEYQESIKEIINQLDKPGKQVMIKAVILAVDHSDMASLGVQLASDPAAFGALSENSLTAVQGLSRLSENGSTTLSTRVSVNFLVDFLIKKADAKVLNQPTLWTKDNEEAIFFKGQRVGFVVNKFDSEEGTQSKESVEYRRVGVTLQVKPNITPEKAVDMTINLGISQVESELINSQLATNELGTITRLIVNDGETIMLGGILFQNDVAIERKLPLIGDLPLLGPFFRHYDTEIRNSELLAFITPYVIDTVNNPETRQIIEDSLNKMENIKAGLKEKTGYDN
jgi:general secretion pathway protein D